MVKLGKTSKRTPVRLRHKIEKASAAKQRKQRKLAKKNPEWRSKVKKDPGIPNLFPYKDKILHEIEERKRTKQEEAMRLREQARERRAAAKGDANQSEAQEPDADSFIEDDEMVDDEMDSDGGDDSNPMAALLASARARAAEFEDEDGDSEDEMDEDDAMDEDDDEDGGAALDDTMPTSAAQSSQKESSRRAFDKVFKQVTDAADVILYVLDARDPQGTRSKQVERDIMAAANGEKRLILILNKIDLVPPPVLRSWLILLRRYFPTLPLKASNGASNARTFDHKQLTVQGTSETLFRALKTYAHNKQFKRAISVGVIGYPNVGKSSVINALTSRLSKGSAAACPVGAEAGITTTLREVKLDSKLKLIDSPGIVFPNAEKRKSSSKKADDQARLVLLNAIPPKQIVDPIPAVSLLINRLSASAGLYSKMLDTYGLSPVFPGANGDKTTDFLIQVARKRGRLGKGGVPNINSAALTVITDWRDGRIQGWVEAPDLPVATSATDTANSGAGGADTKVIVTEWAKEFKIEGLFGDDAQGDEEMAE